MLGYAWQSGLVPVSGRALLRAIELNAVDVERNREAFNWGRIAAAAPQAIPGLLEPSEIEPRAAESLDDIIDQRKAYLVAYQDQALADRYEALVTRARSAAAAVGNRTELTETVARAYFKTLVIKDEYEVARLHAESGFLQTLQSDYGKQARLRFHLAPPLLSRKLDDRGRPRKREFGSWVLPLFRVLARLRFLRGSRLDVFGMTAERKGERALITDFENTLEKVFAGLTADNVDQATAIVAEYLEIRGFGPVKEQAITEARERIDQALAEYAAVSARAA
jgi:indolepyruvate ferredoxin oxidoreductase